MRVVLEHAPDFGAAAASTSHLGGLGRALPLGLVHGWPLDLHDRLPAEIAEVDPAVLDDLADHCRASGVVGLLGDEARLRQAWAAATR